MSRIFFLGAAWVEEIEEEVLLGCLDSRIGFELNVVCCLHRVNGMYPFIDLREMNRGVNRINFIVIESCVKINQI